MAEVILTHCGKLGDFLYTLPIASWLWKTRGTQVHYILPDTFHPFRFIAPLLLEQPCVSKVSLVPHQIQNFNCGGQPYKFEPYFGLKWPTGEYYNLGFRGYPNKFITAYYAEEYGLGWDPGFRLQIGHPILYTREVLRSREGAMARLAPLDAVELPPAVDLLTLARRIAAAAEFHSWFCGLAVLCWFAGIRARVYRVPGHAPLDLYFPEPRGLVFEEVIL